MIVAIDLLRPLIYGVGDFGRHVVGALMTLDIEDGKAPRTSSCSGLRKAMFVYILKQESI